MASVLQTIGSNENLNESNPTNFLLIGNFSVDLQMNRVSRHEGFWALSVKDEFDKPICNLSFGFIDASTILIASVQGIKDSSRNILELNKKLTKDSFGFRPQNLLIATIQSLCTVWNIENLIGIDPKHQVKKRNALLEKMSLNLLKIFSEK